MEIIADQVSCAHGATVADLSPEELFYLQSRGFTKEAARAILIKATVFEFSSRLPCEKVKARISRKIDQLVPKMKERTEFEYSSL
jgi:Fe-S cluster assembly protein SufD